MKYIINFIVISALSFMNIGNCFAEEVNWSPKDNISIYTLILSIITTIVVLLIYHWFFLPIKEIDDDGEQEYRRLHAYNQNIVNQLVKNYLNSNEGKKLIEDFVRKDCYKIIEQIINERFSEKKTVSSPLKTNIQEQSQSVNTQTVNQGYVDKNSKVASIHSALPQQQEVALEQAAVSETHSEANDQLTIKYAREMNNSFTLRDIRDSYQPGKSLYKLTIYKDNTARINPLVEYKEVKSRVLNDNGNLLEPICEIIRNTNNPTDIKITQSGEANFDGTNWTVDHNKKIKIELI